VSADRNPSGQMIFNVGCRRSGTYWLQRIVTAHPDVGEVPSETNLLSHGIAPLLERFQHDDPMSVQVGVAYIERERLLAHIRALCDEVFERFREGRPFVAERTPFHVRQLPLISELYPDSRIIHIIRDGRDVARSIAVQPWGPNTVGGAAEEWRTSVEAGRGAGIGSDRYREVRYETLLANPEGETRALYEWLDLRSSGETVKLGLAEAMRQTNVGPSRRGGIGTGKWIDEWSAGQVADFLRVAGDLLAELGYETSLPRHKRLFLTAARLRRRLGQRTRSLLRSGSS
jgi:hypothetical protein